MSKFIDTVTIAVGHRSLSRTNVDSISMVHYRELLPGDGTPRIGTNALDHAELGIVYRHDEESDDRDHGVVRNEFQCRFHVVLSVCLLEHC